MTSLAFIIGVIPLALASGAGSEMRRSLGIAVFYGMVGVTLFGIFLTPVFFYVILGLSETWQLVTTAARWAGSTLVGGLSGAGVGYMLARADIVPLTGRCGPAGPRGPRHAGRAGHPPRIGPARPKPAGPPPDLVEVSLVLHEAVHPGDRWS